MNLSRGQVFLMKNNLFGFNQSHEILLTGAIPSAFFNSNDYIPPHTPVTLRFTFEVNIEVFLIIIIIIILCHIV